MSFSFIHYDTPRPIYSVRLRASGNPGYKTNHFRQAWPAPKWDIMSLTKVVMLLVQCALLSALSSNAAASLTRELGELRQCAMPHLKAAGPLLSLLLVVVVYCTAERDYV